jgi:FkbM family methyltransferase
MINEIKAEVETFEKLINLTNLILGKNHVESIVEFGSRYGEDTIEFAKAYPKALIYAFECNPNTIVECRENVKLYKNIILTEKAITEQDGLVKFYSINAEKTKTTWEDGNQGASSLLKASGKYPVEDYVQDEIQVEGISLHSFILQNQIKKIDIMWMDIQGAELIALKGLKSSINIVGIFHIEVEFFEIYKSQPLFEEVKTYLIENEFIFMGYTSKGRYSGDAVFINKKLYNKKTCDFLSKQILIREFKPSIFKKIIKSLSNFFKSLR